jgi:hypothetical protein
LSRNPSFLVAARNGDPVGLWAWLASKEGRSQSS